MRDAGPSGLQWLRASLADGGPLSAAVLSASILDTGHVSVALPADHSSLPDPHAGGVVSAAAATAVIVEEILQLAAPSGELVVENDLARPEDPPLSAPLPVAIIGQHVIHPLPLQDATPADCTRVLRQASGYPTNAFLLRDRPSWSDDASWQAAIRYGLDAVIVAAHDAETYAIWTPDIPTHSTT